MTTAEPFLTLGFAAVDWIEHYLVHGPGDVQGQPIELDDEFAAFVVKAYQVDSRGHRKIRRAFLSRSKGRAKSELAAMVECFEALGPARFDHWAADGEVSDWGYGYEAGEPVGKPLVYVEVQNVATEESQAGNTYDNVHFMLHPDSCSRHLRADYGRIDVGLTRISLPNRRGFLEPVTAANESKDGAKSTFIVADETHLWVPPAVGKFKLGKMHQTMVRNLLKRKVASGWMLETSTMYADGEGSVAEGTHAYAKSARKSAPLLFDHRQASESWDVSKRRERIKALREAYGPAAEWMDLDAIADYWDDPQATEAEFRRFWLNQPVPLIEPTPPVFGFGVWEDAAAELAEMPKVHAIGIATGWDRSHTSIGAASAGEHTWVWSSDRGRRTDWVAARAKEIQDRHRCAVVVAGSGPAAPLIPELDEAGVDVTVASAGEYADACAAVYDMAQEKSLRHLPDDDDLNTAVSGAEKAPQGDRWRWSRKTSLYDVSMLEAVTLAAWARPDDEPFNIF